MGNIRYLNVLRLIAAISIVFLHTSAGILDTRTCDDDVTFALLAYKTSLQFAVPLFIMISGALFLNKNKVITFDKIFNKYVQRIVLALICFGLPMCIIEQYISFGPSSLWMAFANFFRGHSWNHMWYLYMLLGLYAITPILKPFVEKSDDRELETGLIVLFVLCCVLPTINKYFYALEGYMLMPSYIFMYILGYYLCWRAKANWMLNWRFPAVIFVICLIIILVKSWYLVPGYAYQDPLLSIMVGAFFLFFRDLDIKWAIADSLSVYCFGVYLIHPVFINIAYKVLNISESWVYPIWGFLSLGFVFTSLSFIGTFIIRKLPVMKKHVL